MNRLLQYHIQVNAAFGSPFNQLRRQLLSWVESSTKPEHDARTQYDIGENDCRPPPVKLAKAYSASLEAMLDRSL
jgi:hypothetical protein